MTQYSRSVHRRQFLAAATAAGAGFTLVNTAGAAEKPALLGGQPVRREPFPSWPKYDSREEKALLGVLHSGKWFRGDGQTVDRFEAAYAKLMGAKHCIATANGTSALFASLGGLQIGPGDEVLLPPYTFVATLNVIMLHYALPIFVDSDPETFQIDARKIEAAVTPRTAAIIPVHLGGSAADLDAILALAGKHKLAVIEDACQAHLGEWRGRKVGTLGTTGCFSFQASKNLNSGEGGAILTGDDAVAQRCHAFHNNGRGRAVASYNFTYLGGRAANLRLTEFQAGLLLAQMTRLEEQSRTREQNAQHLSGMLREVPGIAPAKMCEGCTRNAYHLYMFRYQKDQFAGMPRERFLQALGAEGIPASSGYSPLQRESFIRDTLASRAYQKIYSKAELANWEERNRCPENDRLCQEAVWLTQNMLLGPRRDMEQIAEAVQKIHASAGELAKA